MGYLTEEDREEVARAASELAPGEASEVDLGEFVITVRRKDRWEHDDAAL